MSWMRTCCLLEQSLALRKLDLNPSINNVGSSAGFKLTENIAELLDGISRWIIVTQRKQMLISQHFEVPKIEATERMSTH